MNNIPCIKKINNIDTLYVDGEPFFILGGECHNSSASDLNYMENKVWNCIESLHMNTLIVPITWELIQPKEDIFDFSLVDGIINQARNHDMHLVFLWFGLWKNGESNYVPGWVRKQPEIYSYIKDLNGDHMNIVSPLCEAAIDADANAYRELMKHIKQVDGQEHTILMMQVENEVGVLHGVRDYSNEANELFNSNIPAIVSNEFKVSGTWRECFQEGAEEHFMAYYFAKAIEKIAASGMEEYPIPHFANAWLKQFPWKEGTYPTGGPISDNHKMWKLVAPSLFTLAPDIYVGYVPDVFEQYTTENNPLFVPEVRKDASTAAYCLYAFGKYNAIGYSPFAIEEYGWKQEEIMIPPMEWLIALNIDPTAFQMEGAKEALTGVYALLENIKPLYLEYRGTNKLQAFVKKGEFDYGEILHFEEVDALVTHGSKRPGSSVSGGMIIEVEKNVFYVMGVSGKVEFIPKSQNGNRVDIISQEEGYFTNGDWKSGRRLNGDERGATQLMPVASVQKVEVVLQ